jgi:hypothetical protein
VSVLASVMSEVSSGNPESNLYDLHLLKQLSHADRLFRHGLVAMRLPRHSWDKGTSVRVDRQVVVRAAELSGQIPAPRQVRVLGKLDTVRHSTNSFELIVDGGKHMRGVFESSGQMAELKQFLGQEVLVLGQAIYRPSGTLLRVDVQEIEPGEGQSRLFAKVPPPMEHRAALVRLRSGEPGKRGVAGFFGTWPGDETDAELLAALRELRA